MRARGGVSLRVRQRHEAGRNQHLAIGDDDANVTLRR